MEKFCKKCGEKLKLIEEFKSDDYEVANYMCASSGNPRPDEKDYTDTEYVCPNDCPAFYNN